MGNKNKEDFAPQNGRKLREIREGLGKNQEGMAGKLQDFLKPHMRPGFAVQQPDISRLEREETALDIPRLLAYAHLGNVDIAYLLKEHYQQLCKSELHLKHFPTDEEAAGYLCHMENEGRVLAYSQFPATSFRLNKAGNRRLQQIARSNYPETHFYTLDALLNFIFSPICNYSYTDRIRILQNYLGHFRGNRVKHLHFFSRTDFPETSLFPNLELLPEKGVLLMLAPVMQYQEGDVFLEIRSESICQEVYNFYYEEVNTLDADINLLKSGLDTLEMSRQGFSMESAIRFFYEEIEKRSPEDCATIVANFGPDMREMLEGNA